MAITHLAEGGAHGRNSSAAVLRWGGDVLSIARSSTSSDFRKLGEVPRGKNADARAQVTLNGASHHRRAARERVVHALENENRGALANHKAIARCVEGPRSFAWFRVVLCRERPQTAAPSQG